MDWSDDFKIVCSVDMRPDGTHNAQVVKACDEITNDVRLRDRLDCNRHVRINLVEASQEANEVLYLEDDTVPAKDTLEFIYSVLPAYQELEWVKCISLLGQNHGDIHLAYRNRSGFRVHKFFNCWGNYWSSYKLAQVLLGWDERWNNSDTLPWDARTTGQFLDSDFHSLYPLLSRVKNVGKRGRFCKDDETLNRANTDHWADDDFSKPIAAKFH